MRKRINITLREDTVKLLERVAAKGDRSQLIEEALRSYIAGHSRARLREQLKAGALARSGRDRRLAEEWFTIENEVWPVRKGK